MKPPIQTDIVVSIDLNLSFECILNNLNIKKYDYSALMFAITFEKNNLDRREVIVALRRALDGKVNLNAQSILSSIRGAETRRRRRIVRKIYNSTTIWAMEEIREFYPHYSEELLFEDLKIKRKKKFKNVTGYRISQASKLYDAIKRENFSGNLINKRSHLFARHLNNINKPITMDVNRDGKFYSFDFPAKTDEGKIKEFIISIDKGMSIDHLRELSSRIKFNISGLNK